ncbi:PREDICTED: U6 snRNA-associated Sm-like protein LSm4 isoform X1 [Gavialis gangeticus]|uniref:U6 snRNA-associated Sm-like protein LSm4 isoform X1 n=1 Tax=Gavialis gangeticus TaxID=94835 RepID=UPI00092EE6EF|nr:PREDICTED: U6 snRNA-associated Sm-like protein LSm4 isoform X1 [Gavialis gangeticus]
MSTCAVASWELCSSKLPPCRARYKLTKAGRDLFSPPPVTSRASLFWATVQLSHVRDFPCSHHRAGLGATFQGQRPQEDGDKFWRMPECYIRGSTIKYLRIPDEIIDMVKEEVVSKGRGRGGLQQQKQQKGRGAGGTGRGVFGGRGRGIPGSGRGQQEKKPGRQSAKQ